MHSGTAFRSFLGIFGALLLAACGGGDGGSAGGGGASVTPPPTVTLTSSAASVAFGSSVKLTWSSTDATSCTASSGWAGAKSTSGSEPVGPLNIDTSYALSCSGAGGSANQTASVTVAAPAGLYITSGAPPNGTSGAYYNRGNGSTCYYLNGHSGYCYPCYVGGSTLGHTCPAGYRYEDSFVFRAAGGVSPYTWAAVGLPPGLTVSPDGTFYFSKYCCKPQGVGTYDVTVTVTDSGSPAAQVSASYPIIIAALQTGLNAATPLAAQEQTARTSGTGSRYILEDLGTAGGPNSYVQDVTNPINSKRMVTGIADTPITDPFDPYCIYDCFVVHAFQWQRGALTDLGALAAGASSLPNGINAAGMVAGFSETGAIDPSFDFPPEFHAVVWKDGQIIDLGTFGGTLSYANALNDRGQVVGFALNGKADSFITASSDFDVNCGTGDVPGQMRAFVWQEGRGLRALGTLGGPDSCAKYINQRGQIAGHSFTSYTPNGTTGIPTFEPFIWANGTMTGLGSLGGTEGHANSINSRGQIAGVSNLAGDQTQHAFFWSQGVMRDLTPASDFSYPEGINDKGEVVGAIWNADGTQFAFLWTDGALINLGICGEPLSINAASQVVGHADECAGSGSYAFLWEKDGPAIDLNTLVTPGSGVALTKGTHITDSGEITAQGVLANGDEHAFLLIPRNRVR